MDGCCLQYPELDRGGSYCRCLRRSRQTADQWRHGGQRSNAGAVCREDRHERLELPAAWRHELLERQRWCDWRIVRGRRYYRELCGWVSRNTGGWPVCYSGIDQWNVDRG